MSETRKELHERFVEKVSKWKSVHGELPDFDTFIDLVFDSVKQWCDEHDSWYSLNYDARTKRYDVVMTKVQGLERVNADHEEVHVALMQAAIAAAEAWGQRDD